ncbi:MAG TPA: CBS domain-containing protein [Terriglobales bacterium]|nr:CBS domain-containing protein [Terriglobales bacterium]
MKVSEVMTRNPACCWLSSSALAAALMMKERDTGILPVTQDPFTPRLVGVVTDRDLCLHVVAGGRDPAYIWISECLTQDPVCCTPEDDVHHALELMKERQVRRLPVVNVKREIVGMLSLSDLARNAGVDSWEIATALQKICEPGHVTRESPETIISAA